MSIIVTEHLDVELSEKYLYYQTIVVKSNKLLFMWIEDLNGVLFGKSHTEKKSFIYNHKN